MPGESARSGGKDPGHAAGLDGAGEECGGEPVPSAGVCAAPGLLQELPRHDVSRAGSGDAVKTFFLPDVVS